MATNKVSDGRILQTVATGGAFTKGWLMKRGSIMGVALGSATGAGAALRLDISSGVWSLDKIAAASTNMAVGAKVYSRATGSAARHKVLGVATGSVIGTCIVAAATGDTTAIVKLHPHSI